MRSIAELIIKHRKEAGLTQIELADLVNTKQSVISRMESPKYKKHSLNMLQKIAAACGCDLKIILTKEK